MNNLSSTSLKRALEALKQADQNATGTFEIGEDTICDAAAAISELLALREAGKEAVAYMYRDRLHKDARFSYESKIGNWSQDDINEYEITETKLYAAPQLPAVPMQPLEIDAHSTLRFKQNAIIRKLLDHGTATGYGLNEMAQDDYSAEDRMQLAQLIGYSLSGYGTLSYVTDESYDRAIAAAPKPE